ncbi:hypothetical protein SEVIR_7G018104v4 [Setaria viridis]
MELSSSISFAHHHYCVAVNRNIPSKDDSRLLYLPFFPMHSAGAEATILPLLDPSSIHGPAVPCLPRAVQADALLVAVHLARVWLSSPCSQQKDRCSNDLKIKSSKRARAEEQ